MTVSTSSGSGIRPQSPGVNTGKVQQRYDKYKAPPDIRDIKYKDHVWDVWDFGSGLKQNLLNKILEVKSP